MNRALKCRVGDLAVVIGAYNKCNVGKIVKVVDTYSPDKASWMEGIHDAFDWIVESPSPLVWGGAGRRWRRKRGPAPDFALQPIRGADESQSVQQVQPVTLKRKRSVKTKVTEPAVMV